MPTLRFEPSALGPAQTTEVPEGGHLIDACDEARAPIPFSCRSATCGTCRIEILAGAPHLDAPGAEEAQILALFDAPPTHRLACQVRIHPGPGLVHVRSIDD